MLCVRMYAVCRSHLCIVNVREYEVQTKASDSSHACCVRNICAVRSVMRCTCTDVSCEWMFFPHLPSVVGRFISRPTETGPI